MAARDTAYIFLKKTILKAFSYFTSIETDSSLAKFDTNASQFEFTKVVKVPAGVSAGDAVNKSQLDSLLASVEGSIKVIGFWDADTNSPDLSALTLDQGEAYQVSVAGTTTLNGENNWKVKDLVVWDDDLSGNYFKLDNTDDVESVNSQTGVVSLTADDIPDGVAKAIITQSQETSFAAAYTHSQEDADDDPHGLKTYVDNLVSGGAANLQKQSFITLVDMSSTGSTEIVPAKSLHWWVTTNVRFVTKDYGSSYTVGNPNSGADLLFDIYDYGSDDQTFRDGVPSNDYIAMYESGKVGSWDISDDWSIDYGQIEAPDVSSSGLSVTVNNAVASTSVYVVIEGYYLEKP